MSICEKEEEFENDLEFFQDELENVSVSLKSIVSDLTYEKTLALELLDEIYRAKSRGKTIDGLVADLINVTRGRIAQ